MPDNFYQDLVPPALRATHTHTHTVFRDDRVPECRQFRIARSFQRMKLRFLIRPLVFHLSPFPKDNYYRGSNETEPTSEDYPRGRSSRALADRANRKFTSQPSVTSRETHVRNPPFPPLPPFPDRLPLFMDRGTSGSVNTRISLPRTFPFARYTANKSSCNFSEPSVFHARSIYGTDTFTILGEKYGVRVFLNVLSLPLACRRRLVGAGVFSAICQTFYYIFLFGRSF